MERGNVINESKFYVVQFIEMPFESIDDYVCVPYSWITRMGPDQKALVAYPSNEDPFDTRERAERRENYEEEWRSYMALVKFTSDTYRVAEYWIATRNDYGPIVEKDSGMMYEQAQPMLNVQHRKDEYMVNHSPSPEHGVASDCESASDCEEVSEETSLSESSSVCEEVSEKISFSESSSDCEEASDHEMSANNAPVETNSKVYNAGNSTGNNSPPTNEPICPRTALYIANAASSSHVTPEVPKVTEDTQPIIRRRKFY